MFDVGGSVSGQDDLQTVRVSQGNRPKFIRTDMNSKLPIRYHFENPPIFVKDTWHPLLIWEHWAIN